MKKIKKILFPTDFSDTANNAFRYALRFADKYGASIELLHVIYPEAEPLDFPVMVAQMTQKRIEAGKVILKTFVETSLAQVQAAGQLQHVPEVKPDIEVGIPSTLIPEIAKRKEADLVIMGTQGEHSAFERAFGSVTTATLRKASCPVLVVPNDFNYKLIESIAYATDLDESDPYRIWEVSKLLSPFCPILRAVHIEQRSTEETPLTMQDLEAFFKDHAPTLQITFHNIASANVEDELEDFVGTWGVDLLVMYKPQRKLFERIFHSSLTKKTVLHTETPLLVLK